jgi:cell division protein FtsW (lipid II flippase)
MIAGEAPTVFARLLAGAITLSFFTYAFVNMGMVSGVLPVVGIPLPFISYGGSALTINLVAIGVLLSISRETSQTGSLFDAIGGFRRRDRRAHLPRAGRRARAGTRSSRRR